MELLKLLEEQLAATKKEIEANNSALTVLKAKQIKLNKFARDIQAKIDKLKDENA